MQRVSIIIPVLNEEKSIKNSLVQLQSYRQLGHELIVVDGGSTDATADIAIHLCDKLVTSNSGRSRQMNKGAHHAHGDILLFLHADTLLPEAACETIIKQLRVTNKCWGRFDVKLSGSSPAFSLIAFLMNLRSRLTGIATGDQAIFILQKTFRRIGGYPDVPLMEDIRISRTLLSFSRPLCISKKVITSSRRWEEKGIIRTIFLMWYLRFAHFFGKSPDDLARIYSR